MNSVLSSMPLYFMSFYYFSEWIIQAIDRIRKTFFQKDTRNIHGELCLINWQLVCTHKNQVGLGVCNLQIFNLALLPKWIWKFFHDACASWVAFVAHSYYRRRKAHDVQSSLPRYVSLFWRSVLKATKAFASDITIVVGANVQQDFA